MSSIVERARQLDASSLTAVEVLRLVRELRTSTSNPQVRMAFAGNIVFDPLPEFVQAHLLCHAITSSSHTASFSQPLQELLDPASALRAFDPDFLFLHFELDALLPGLFDRRTEDDSDGWRAAVAAVLETVSPSVRAALSHTRAVVLLTNFVGPDCYDLGIADPRAEFGEQDFFAQLNSSVAKAFRSEPRVQIVDLCRLTAWYGRGRARDRRLYYIAKLPWQQSFLPVLADEISRHVGAALGRLRKCLVVDLDNTLWGGVLGEDGPHGIRVGIGDPVGEAHLDLQRRILALRKRGILLAACSKNNPDEVAEVFRVRTDMPVRRDDFVAFELGWGMKHEGVRRIAERLNIGTDSLVFLDDNEAELELIRQFLPEVLCVRVPSDPAMRPGCLDRVHGLDRVLVTAEDLARTGQYRSNAARDASRGEFEGVRSYLHSLRTRIRIEPASVATLARAHQLFAKTNQFNLTTRRYGLAELEAFAADKSCRLLVVRAEDRFGNLGWIGAVLLRGLARREVSIDNFILSCRAMGRDIESAVMNHLKRECFERAGGAAMTADYVPTPKNVPAASFYERQGFTRAAEAEAGDGVTRYRLARERSVLAECEWIHTEGD